MLLALLDYFMASVVDVLVNLQVCFSLITFSTFVTGKGFQSERTGPVLFQRPPTCEDILAILAGKRPVTVITFCM